VPSWPLAAQAQRSKTFRVGILANEKWPPLDGLRDGLRSLGYVEGQNLELVKRYVEGETAKYPSFAAELVGFPVDVIVTWGTPASLAAKDATATIPIIMTSGDPVAVGLVSGLAQQQGNITGFSTQAAELEGKRLELVNELIADVSRVVVLSNPSNPYCTIAVEQARRAAAVLHVKLDVVEIGHERELDDAFVRLTRIRPNAILVVADPFLASQPTRIAEFLVRAKIPSIYTYREQVTAGGLVSYATNYYELFSAGCVYGRQDSQRIKAGRSAGRAADQIRTCHQPQNCEGHWSRCVPGVTVPRRRGDRVTKLFGAVHMSSAGTFRTCSDV
jgi:putative tryptophan/tyrosine transport system substrate-binding protein